MTMLKLFAPDGAEVVATADWVPASAMLSPDGVRLEPDGGLALDFHDLRLAWDGVVTETEDGFPVHLTADGTRVREDRLTLRQVDGDGAPFGAAMAFTARRTGPVFDQALAMRAAALAMAAESVLDSWEHGDLAAAVRELAESLTGLRSLIPALLPPTPDADTDTDTDHGEPA
jgi:hypothetical protein